MGIVAQQRETIGTGPACTALSVPRASFYRWLNPKPPGPFVSRRFALLAGVWDREGRAGIFVGKE
jgi:hypothetical protein